MLSVLLNPEGRRPLGVNATMPEGLKKARELETCLREAVADVDYPSYEGRPVVVEFEIEIDPGFEEVEA